MHQILTALHVIAGGFTLLVGLVIMLGKKGGKRHIQLGWSYVIAMWVICLSAFSIIAFYRFSFFLMVIGVLTFHFTFVGVRVMRRSKNGTEQWYDWLVSIMTALFGLGLIGYAVHIFLLVGGYHMVSLLSAIFGIGTLATAWKDLKVFIQKPALPKNWWIEKHISMMGGSYIAAVTALAVQNGTFLLPSPSYSWLLWVMPGVIGGRVISRVIRRRRPASTLKHG